MKWDEKILLCSFYSSSFITFYYILSHLICIIKFGNITILILYIPNDNLYNTFRIFDIYYNLNNYILQQHNYSYCSHFIENQS